MGPILRNLKISVQIISSTRTVGIIEKLIRRQKECWRVTNFRIVERGMRKDKVNAAVFWWGWEEVGSEGSNGPERSHSQVQKKDVKGESLESLEIQF